jgi:hypothetical protein
MRLRTDARRRNYAVYVCANRATHTPSACAMPVVHRKAVDSAVADLFGRSLLDERRTLDEIERAAQAQDSEIRTLLAAAEREVARCDDQLVRQKRRWRDGEITTAEKDAEVAEITGERDAAEAEAGRMRARVAEVYADAESRNAQRALHALVEDVRRLGQGFVPDAPEAALTAALRTALSQVVERVELLPPDGAPDPSRFDAYDGAPPVYVRRPEVVIAIYARTVMLLGTAGNERAAFPYFRAIGVPIARNSTFTSQKTRRRPRRRTRSSS